jgi:transposase-like protein
VLSCPNPECLHGGVFGAGNLRVSERNGKGKRIRRLFCRTCKTRFSERRGSLMEHTHLPEEKLVLIFKCLTYGNSVAATADIAGVDERTVQRIVDRGGGRARRFHDQKAREIAADQAQLDEVHTKAGKKRTADRRLDLHVARGRLALRA